MATPKAQSRVPAIPEPGRGIDPQTRKAIVALKEALEIRLGRSRTPIDAAVTFRDLKEGVQGLTLGSEQNGGTIDGGEVPPFINQLPRPDYSPPPAPTNVQTSGGFDYVFISWDRPQITGDYYAEVFRYTVNDLDSAQSVGPIGFTQGPGIQYSDAPDSPVVYFYWVRFVKVVYGRLIPGPFHGSNGIQGQITQDPNHIINIISGYIAESDLAANLASRIAKIDISDTISAHVANQLLTVSQRLDDISGDTRTLEEFYNAFETLEQAISDPESGVDLTAVVNRLEDLEQQVFNVNNGSGASQLNIRQFYSSYEQLETSANSPAGEIRTKLLAGQAAENRINALDDGSGGTTNLESVISRFNTVESDVTDASTGLATRAAQSDFISLQSQVDAMEGAGDASVIVQRVSALESQVDDPATGLSTKAAQSQIDTIQSDIDSVNNEVGSYTSSINQLNSSVGDIEAALEISGSTSARLDDIDTVLSASYTVKVDLDGRVIGFSIAGETGEPSEFVVRADRVFFLDPSRSGTFQEGKNYSSVDALPDEFIMGYAKIDGVTRFAINAPTYIPEGSIRTLHVKNLDFSKITGFDINTEILNVNRTGWITNAMIGNVIQSTWPNASNPSWKLDKRGKATFRGINIYHENTGELIFSSGSGVTWEAINGRLPGNKLDINKNNMDDYFAPESIDGVTYLKHASVDTLQIRGQAVTFPVYLKIPGVPISLNAYKKVGSVSWVGSGAITSLFVAVACQPPVRVTAGTGWLSFKDTVDGLAWYRLKLNGKYLSRLTPSSDLTSYLFGVPTPPDSAANAGLYGLPEGRMGLTQVRSRKGTNTLEIEANSQYPKDRDAPQGTYFTGEKYLGEIAARIFAIELRDNGI